MDETLDRPIWFCMGPEIEVTLVRESPEWSPGVLEVRDSVIVW